MSEYKENWFAFSSRMLLYALAVLIPVWLVPGRMAIDFGREITFTIVVVIAAALFLLSVLTRAEVRYPRSWILYGGMLLAAGMAASTFYSKAPFVSLVLAPPVAERFSTLLLGLIVMALGAMVVRSHTHARAILTLFFASSTLAATAVLVRILSGFSLYRLVGSNFGQTVDFNVIGTINGFSLFLASVLMAEVGVLFFAGSRLRPWKKYLFAFSALVCSLDIILINFLTSWMIILGAGVVLLGILLKDLKFRSDNAPLEGRTHLKREWRYPILLLILALSLFMLVTKRSFVQVNFPAEVAPTFARSVSIGQSVMKEGVRSAFLGSGPGTFGLDWMKYKISSINETPFWNLRFNQGSSWVSTLLATTGIVGIGLFVLFIAIAAFVFLRAILVSKEDIPFREGVFVGFLGFGGAAFLYPANPTFLLMLFFLIGLEIAILKKPIFSPDPVRAYGPDTQGSYPEESGSDDDTPAFPEESMDENRPSQTAGRITEYPLEFKTPWAMFISSLVIVFLLFFAFWAFYYEVGRVRAAMLQQSGLAALEKGDLEAASAKFQEAIAHEDKNYLNYQSAAQVEAEKVRSLIQRAAAGENVQNEFQAAVTHASQLTKTAAEMFPQEPSVWRVQGALYELIIPYIDGAQNLAIANYRKASELDPMNPSLYVDMGRTGMVFAERILFVENQSTDTAEREKLQALYAETLNEVAAILKKAIELKQDYAEAHFMLAQTALRLGNLKDAIRSTEDARTASPMDIGIAFQLGILYYQNNEMEKARAELERAVSINKDYSNARYFLGLVYDRKGEKAQAIAEFEAIEKLNPDNAELKKILENLHAGKPALTAIAPPGTAPEKRTEPPVKETQKK